MPILLGLGRHTLAPDGPAAFDICPGEMLEFFCARHVAFRPRSYVLIGLDHRAPCTALIDVESGKGVWYVTHRIGQAMPSGHFQTFDTADVPRPDRIRRWAEFASETFAVIDTASIGGGEFNAQVARVQIGNIGMSWMTMGSVSFDVEGGLVGSWAAPASGSLMLSLQEAGSCIGRYPAGEFTANPGDMVLVDPLLLPRWHLVSPNGMGSIAIKLPAHLVLGMIDDPQVLSGVRLGAEIPKVAFAASVIISLKRTIASHPDEGWDDDYEALLVDTIGSVLRGSLDRSSPRQNQFLLRAVCALVERRLDDPDFDTADMASNLGVTKRTVQRTFAEIGFTPRSYILNRRIFAAAGRISRESLSSITDIAMSLGFNDLSYFSRSFRTEIGVSPRQYRAGKRRIE